MNQNAERAPRRRLPSCLGRQGVPRAAGWDRPGAPPSRAARPPTLSSKPALPGAAEAPEAGPRGLGRAGRRRPHPAPEPPSRARTRAGGRGAREDSAGTPRKGRKASPRARGEGAGPRPRREGQAPPLAGRVPEASNRRRAPDGEGGGGVVGSCRESRLSDTPDPRAAAPSHEFKDKCRENDPCQHWVRVSDESGTIPSWFCLMQ